MKQSVTDNSEKVKLTIGLMFLLILLQLIVQAQNPGYIGKKAVVGYGLYVNPAFNAVRYGYGNFINKQHELFIDAAVNIRTSVGMFFKWCKTSYNNSADVHINGEYLKPSGQVDINAKTYEFHLKRFRPNYVAPWGKYVLWGLAYTMYTSSYDPDKMWIPVRSSVAGSYPTQYITANSNNFGPTTRNSQYLDIVAGKGNRRIFKNSFALDYGYTVNIIATAFSVIDIFDDYEYMDVYIQRKSEKRIRSINRFNFFLKLGYLF